MRWDGDTPLGTSDIMERRDPTPDRPYGEMWMPPQWRAMEILGAHLAELGTQIDFNSELTGLTRDEHGVTATVRHPDGTDEPIRARYLVAADGGRSTVCKSLGVGFDGDLLDSPPMLIGDAITDGLSRDHWHVRPTAPGGLVSLAPIRGSETFYVLVHFTVRKARAATTEKAPDKRSGTDLARGN
jgi:2-polyprenyl-6-methoxyphenol hydroxylase-like FAD-dependent oxidoreductase